MARDFIFRANEENQYLFELQESLEREQDMTKRGMTNRFLKYAASAPKEELEVAKLQKSIGKPSGTTPNIAKIPVDDEIAEAVIKRFREVFDLERPQIRFVVRVSQYAYISHLRNEIKERPMFDVEAMEEEIEDDPYEKRILFDISDCPEKEELYEVSRAYLEEVDVKLWSLIRNATNAQVKSWTRAYRLERFIDSKGPMFGKTNIILHAKVLAGASIALYEAGYVSSVKIIIDAFRNAIITGEPL